MSALAPLAPQAQSAFIQVAGTQLALPPNARPDLAFTASTPVAQPAAGADASYTVQGQYLEVPLCVACTFNTSNQVASRGVLLSVNGAPSTVTLAAWPAAAVQAASLDIDYTFSAGAGSAYGPVAAFSAVSFPAFLLFPTYVLNVSANNIQTNDQFSAIVVTTIKIPTGPALVSAMPPAATPLLT